MRIRNVVRASMFGSVVTALAVMAIPATVWAEPPSRPALIAGRVTLPNHTGVEGADVRLKRGDQVTASTVSNADGLFRFENIRPGPFTVGAHKEGVGAGLDRGTAKPGEVTRARITLRRSVGVGGGG